MNQGGSWGIEIDCSEKIFVGGLPKTIDHAKLITFFTQFGASRMQSLNMMQMVVSEDLVSSLSSPHMQQSWRLPTIPTVQLTASGLRWNLQSRIVVVVMVVGSGNLDCHDIRRTYYPPLWHYPLVPLCRTSCCSICMFHNALTWYTHTTK